MKSKILVQVLILIIIVFAGCSSRNKVTLSNDWLEYTKQIDGMIYPNDNKILIQDKKDIQNFLKLMNGLKYNKIMTEEEAVEQGILPPGTEYNFVLTNSNHNDKLYISYGIKDKALGLGDRVYILQEDISEKINSLINESK